MKVTVKAYKLLRWGEKRYGTKSWAKCAKEESKQKMVWFDEEDAKWANRPWKYMKKFNSNLILSAWKIFILRKADIFNFTQPIKANFSE